MRMSNVEVQMRGRWDGEPAGKLLTMRRNRGIIGLSLVSIAETGDAVKMQAHHTYSAKFYREGICALSHNNKHPERLLLRDILTF